MGWDQEAAICCGLGSLGLGLALEPLPSPGSCHSRCPQSWHLFLLVRRREKRGQKKGRKKGREKGRGEKGEREREKRKKSKEDKRERKTKRKKKTRRRENRKIDHVVRS